MKAVSQRPKPQRPPIVVHLCHYCHVEWATYEGALPRGWIRLTPTTVCCRRCRR